MWKYSTFEKKCGGPPFRFFLNKKNPLRGAIANVFPNKNLHRF